MGVMPQGRGEGRGAIVALGEDRRAELRGLYEREVATNIFSLSWMENYGLVSRRPGVFEYRGVVRDGTLEAVALVITDRLVLLAAADPADAGALGAFYARKGAWFGHVVSARDDVEAFWRGYTEHYRGVPMPSARLISPQRVYELDTVRWDELDGGATYPESGLRRARPGDLDPLLLASAQMHLEETGEDPLDKDAPAFRGHVRHRVETGRSFVWFEGHRLVFKADVSAQSKYGVQISGVYTAPRERGRGIATRAMRDLCATLFDRGWPRVTLYVNESNVPARKVYERVGFEALGPYTTVFVRGRKG